MTEIHPLDLVSVDRLGPRARRCVYWQSDGDSPEDFRGDPEFEKEAWISRVSLEWGVCGQVAGESSRPAAAAFYAPPAMVPRADYFPTSPVGADAILLAGLTLEEGGTPSVLSTLLQAVVDDLRGRGVKAVETFGATTSDPGSVTSRDSCGAESCVSRTGFLVEHGFVVVADHPSFPRLRLDIESEHLWKADVEHALDQLFLERGIPTRTLGELCGVTARQRSTERGQERWRCS